MRFSDSIVLRHSIERPQLGSTDRVVMIVLSRLNRLWREAMHIVQPDTLLRWHRDLFEIVWRRKSRPKGQSRQLAPETLELIQTMAISNARWGAERIRGEPSFLSSESA